MRFFFFNSKQVFSFHIPYSANSPILQSPGINSHHKSWLYSKIQTAKLPEVGGCCVYFLNTV